MADSVVEGDPAHPLFAGGDFPARRIEMGGLIAGGGGGGGGGGADRAPPFWKDYAKRALTTRMPSASAFRASDSHIFAIQLEKRCRVGGSVSVSVAPFP